MENEYFKNAKLDIPEEVTEMSELELESDILSLERELGGQPGRHLLKTYLNEINALPRLTAEEEAAAWASRTQSDVESIINSHLRLVIAVANRIVPYASMAEQDFMDVVQAGNMGLVRATNTYKTEVGTKFSTYAYRWITSYVREEINNKRNGVIKKPTHVSHALGVISKIEGRLNIALGREPTDQELEVVLNGIFSDEKIDELMVFRNPVLSLEMPYGDAATDGGDGSATLSSTMPDTVHDEEMERQELSDAIVAAVKKALSPKMATLILARFGIGEFKDAAKTLAETAELLAERGLTKKPLSQERIRQLEMVAIDTLRHDPNMKNLFN